LLPSAGASKIARVIAFLAGQFSMNTMLRRFLSSKSLRGELRHMRIVGYVARSAILSLVILGRVATAQELGVPPQEELLAIVGVDVVPMDTDRVLRGHTVLVSNGRILRVAPVSEIQVPQDARRIEGRGRFLMPGLADMHSHVVCSDDLTLNLANGVTFVRVMWGEEPTLKLREEVRSGRIAGPRMLVGSRITDGEPPVHFGSFRVTNEAEAEQVAQAVKAGGYDFIKIYSNLSLPAFDAIAGAARRNGIPFAGHVPLDVPLLHAYGSGMGSIEHLTGFDAATAPTGSKADAQRPFKPHGRETAQALGRGNLTLTQVFDSDKRTAAARAAARAQIWNVPTLSVARVSSMSPSEFESVTRRPQMRYLSPAIRRLWAGWGQLVVARDAQEQRGRALLFGERLRQVAALGAAGAELLAGTDAPNPAVFPGFSLHDELALLIRAGLTPYQALRAATVNPAQYAGHSSDFGMIKEGMRADLLLLDADPLADIRNTQRIAGVMADGRWYATDSLHARLERIAAATTRLENRFATAPSLVAASEKKDEVFSAEFRLLSRQEEIGAERYVVLSHVDGSRLVRAQESAGSGPASGIRYHELAIGKDGQVSRYALSASGTAPNRAVVLERAAEGWTLESGKSRTTIAAAACDGVITQTMADAAVLGDLLQVLQGTSRTLRMCTLSESESEPLRQQTWVLRREPPQSIIAIGLVVGANVYRIDISGESAVRSARFWLGGRLLEGQTLQGERTDLQSRAMRLERYL
jgi:imidazolonepropionase-like amidohydrolase